MKPLESFVTLCAMLGFCMIGIVAYSIFSYIIDSFKRWYKKRKEEKMFVVNMPNSIGRITDILQDECGDFIVTVKCSTSEFGRLAKAINERSVHKDGC